MSKTTNSLRLVLNDVLPAAGFSRKGDSWFRRTDEVVEVLNLQKSQHAHQYYLNYALWLRALGEEPFPKEENCHIRMRVSAIVSSEERLASFLDLDSEVEERQSGFSALLINELLPFAESCRTIHGLRSLLAGGRLKRAMVQARVKGILNPSSPCT